MSEQDGPQASTKRHRSRHTSKQNGAQPTGMQRPSDDDKEAWKTYWKEQGQTWRTEPEIDAERQKYLAERHSITSDVKQGIYPFDNIKLSRADVEWLLATRYEHAPLNGGKVQPYERWGLDLRGADLRLEDLSRLPFSNINNVYLNMLLGTSVDPSVVSLELTNLSEAHLEGTDLRGAILMGIELRGAYLSGAKLSHADLSGVGLRGADLSGVDLSYADLSGADLSQAFFDSRTSLKDIVLDKKLGAFLADIHWNDVNIAVIDWPELSVLGEEHILREEKRIWGTPRDLLIDNCRTAVRAYRQLAVVLRNQGLNEDAARFAYRAQLMQRKVFWHQGKYLQYLFPGFLDLLAGYGYKPWRSFLAYLIVITAFATAYFIIGRIVGPVLSPVGSFVFSMTSFHGRGFFPGGITLDDPLTILAAIEAFIGLLVEVTFIATLTQRLFGK